MAISFIAGKPEPARPFFVPAGTYKLQVIEAKEDSSKAGNEMIVLTFKVIMPDGTDGPRFKEQLVFTPKCQWKIDGFYKACDSHPGEGNPFNTNPATMVGWTCEAKLKVRTFDGNKGDKVTVNEIDAFLWEDFSA